MMRVFTAFTMCLCMGFVSPATASGLISVQEVTGRDGALARRMIKEMDKPEVQKRIAELGVPVEEARQRIAALSDEEIRDLANRQGPVQAGGDVVIGITTLLLIIIIILLIKR